MKNPKNAPWIEGRFYYVFGWTRATDKGWDGKPHAAEKIQEPLTLQWIDKRNGSNKGEFLRAWKVLGPIPTWQELDVPQCKDGGK